MTRKLLLAGALLALVGCAQHEYQLLSPRQNPDIIGYHQRLHVSVPPLDYSFRAYQNHLIVWIANPTDRVIQLLGDESFVVSPDGQSHTLRSRAIGGHSFIKLILPPVEPPPEPSGPIIIFGAGYTTGSAAKRPQPAHADGPYYCSIDPATDATDPWEWHDGQQVRLELVFLQGNQKFSQKFIFQRRHI